MNAVCVLKSPKALRRHAHPFGLKCLFLPLLVAALAILLSACKQSTTSVDDCLAGFMVDINNADRSALYKNLDSASSMYGQVKADPSYWNTYFPVSGISYALSGTNADGNFVDAVITSTNDASFAGGLPIVFETSTDSDKNAVIYSITFKNIPIFN